MGDFVSKTVSKSANRELTTPIATIIKFNTIGQAILANPFGCTSYLSGGETIAAVRQTASYIAGSVIYKNAQEKEIGSVKVSAPDSTGFSTGIAHILADSALTTAMKGTPSHLAVDDTYSLTFSCHDGDTDEVYKITLTRDKMTVSGYVSDSILTKIETWADTQEDLA